ncbi:ankyrin repeats (3 copies) domain-containing protein [Pochonia chlamydosporia 170]|uniref:Ankyrin repeats (3 copies) domain-containing protein n=1 Tax=Pochonia chlamydosporia 170 TaxID=1380566 RepID=A0A179F1U4_METCM|nr:ankyrin repeats (3 copies) domain-containing protein [Pochonia chlamydosporia 170]OAQ59049.1 ankyrin repeats (3 copies) domain-containing protein [Pochonia chlamydosporia 170]
MLLRLPTELLLNIVAYLDTPRCLWAVVQCCRFLAKKLTEELYKSDRQDGKALLWGAKKGRKITVLRSLEVAADKGGDAMVLAAQHGHGEIVNLILGGGVDVNSKHEGGTALIRASEHGHLDVVELLLQHGADVNLKNQQGSPLILASKQGHLDVVQLLIEHGAKIDGGDSKGFSALRWAVHLRRVGVVKVLLDAGANVKCEEFAGMTSPLLIWAVRSESASIVGLALGKGADIESTDIKYRLTPLYWATKLGVTGIARLLTKHGADVNCINSGGQTALHQACGRGFKDMVALLLQKGADIRVPDNSGQTAVHWAAKNDNTDIMNLLLDHGADLTWVDCKGRTALGIASQRSRAKVVKFCLYREADVHWKDVNGCDALKYAAWIGSLAIVTLLLEKSANVGSQDNNHHTAIYWAVEGGKAGVSSDARGQVVQLLVKTAASANQVKSDELASAIEWAAESAQEVLASFLRRLHTGSESRHAGEHGEVALAKRDRCLYPEILLAVENKSPLATVREHDGYLKTRKRSLTLRDLALDDWHPMDSGGPAKRARKNLN